MSSMMTNGMEAWKQLLDEEDILKAQYDVLAGRLPQAWYEVVIIVDENNEITDYMLFSLGLKDPTDLRQMMLGAQADTVEQSVYTYEELMSLTYKLVPQTAFYEKRGEIWIDRSSDDEYMIAAVDEAPSVKVVGILREIGEGGMMGGMSGGVGYTGKLIDHLLEIVNNSEVALAQLSHPETDIFSGKPFQTATYQENLARLGIADKANPSSIRLYPKDFASKGKITELILTYNKEMTAAGQDDKTIQYTDITDMLMRSVDTVISGISTVLIAFVAVSLVVSSIMIGIITYISVLERTKEIGILRSIGASKGDISRVFNAETLIVGFLAGALGIAATLLLCIPVNTIVKSLSGIGNAAQLPVFGAVSLVLISMALTFIAGLIPSRFAAKKDPVVALRTE